jgi:prepilin-type N-terminal cleavage/methylation domain-containing protein
MNQSRQSHRPTNSSSRRLGRNGFTLVEVMIACTLGAIVLAGVLSSVLMITRSGARLYMYNGMEADSRKTLEGFAMDVRMANASVLNSSTSVTLTVPDNYAANANQVTYSYGSVTIGAMTYNNCFYRSPADTSSAVGSVRILISNVTSCNFVGYNVLDGVAANDAATKRIELTLTVSTTGNTLVAATDNIVSANYMLRNKI